MKRRRLTISGSNVHEEGEDAPTNQLNGEVKLGDLIWVRIPTSSWWPAQVVDANTVSESMKPNNRSVGEVLVRLYGSYQYLFVDPMKFRSEFEHVLKQNNGSYREILNKSVERDRPNSYSGSKRKGSMSKDEALTPRKLKQSQAIVVSETKVDILKGKSSTGGRLMRAQKNDEMMNGSSAKKDDSLKKLKQGPMTPTSEAPSMDNSQEMSGRRVKVMQSLGLVAPSGSPFRKVRRVHPFDD